MGMTQDMYQLAHDAVDALKAYRLAPTERHMAVMLAVLNAKPPELARTFQDMVVQKMPITPERMEYLYATYLGTAQDKQVQESAENARKIFAEMLQSIQQFSGSTSEVTTEMGARMNTLSDAPTEAELRTLAARVVESAATLKGSGESLNEKLAASQKEITALKENLARVTEESEVDFLTHVPNRKAFDTRLRDLMSDAERDKTTLSLLMVDVDHFKKFNDTYGHLIGDEVLKIVARTLTDSVKGMDTVARFGGEEFAVILPNTPVKGGMIVGEAIRKAIASRELKRKDTGATYGTITVSIGVSSYRHGCDDADAMISRADAALYAAKHAGRNQVMQELL